MMQWNWFRDMTNIFFGDRGKYFDAHNKALALIVMLKDIKVKSFDQKKED